jgi:hypothetical protein
MPDAPFGFWKYAGLAVFTIAAQSDQFGRIFVLSGGRACRRQLFFSGRLYQRGFFNLKLFAIKDRFVRISWKCTG